MFLTPRQRIRIESIKQQNEHSQEMINIFQSILDQEWPKATFEHAGAHAPEMRMRLEKMHHDLEKHRKLIAENERLIAKLETPFWKIHKLFI